MPSYLRVILIVSAKSLSEAAAKVIEGLENLQELRDILNELYHTANLLKDLTCRGFLTFFKTNISKCGFRRGLNKYGHCDQCWFRNILKLSYRRFNLDKHLLRNQIENLTTLPGTCMLAF